MSLPDAWVERLIARLQLRYGAEWNRAYAGIDPNAVKADWAHVLSGVTLDGLDLGIKRLPADRPPNAMQFRALCFIAAPAPVAPSLPAPKADPALVRRLAAQMRQRGEEFGRMTPAAHCIVNVHTSPGARKRGGIDQAQAEVIRACCRVLTESDRQQLAAMGYSLREFQEAEA